MKLSSLFKNSLENSSSSSSSSSSTTISPWPWSLPTCGKPKTLSFRLEKNPHNNIFNSTYHLDDDNETTSHSLDEFFSEFDETSISTSTTTTTNISGQDCIEKMIKGLRLEKERLFFEPEETSSILDFQESMNISTTNTNVVDEGLDISDNNNNIIISFVPMGLDSKDPFVDFRKSMEEMVEANEIKDWESLEELLTCYLKVNCKSNHGYIVGAFVDLLVNFTTFNSCHYHHENNKNNKKNCVGVSESTMTTIDEEQCLLSSTTLTSHSFTSPLSFYSSSSSCSTSNSSITSTSASLSLLEEEDEDDEDEVIQRKKQC